MSRVMLTEVQLAQVEAAKSYRYLEHLINIQASHYREEREARIKRLQQRLQEYEHGTT